MGTTAPNAELLDRLARAQTAVQTFWRRLAEAIDRPTTRLIARSSAAMSRAYVFSGPNRALDTYRSGVRCCHFAQKVSAAAVRGHSGHTFGSVKRSRTR
jgi:hypothetical protein